MDPRDWREGSLKPCCKREETPGKEATDGSAIMLRQRRAVEEEKEEENDAGTADGDDATHLQLKPLQEDDGDKYEEELDPRIQACFPTVVIKIHETFYSMLGVLENNRRIY